MGRSRWVTSASPWRRTRRSEEHTSELLSREKLVCRILLEKKKRGLYLAAGRASVVHARIIASSLMPCCGCRFHVCVGVFFFNDTATTDLYTLSLHDALPI